MNALASYAPLLPEIIVSVGAVALMVLGVVGREGREGNETVGWLAMLTLAVAAIALLKTPVGISPLFNGAFHVDSFARFMKLLVLAGSGFALLLTFDYFRSFDAFKFELPVLILLATAGMMMMVSAGDLVALYLGLELQSLALYVVAAIRRDDVRSSEAGLKYFVLGALSSGMLLYGASMLYGFTGSTSFAVIASVAKAQAAGTAPNLGLMVGFVFLLVGIAFKISAVPFHMWTPDVYEGAPTPVTAFFASAPKMAAMALLVRVVMTAFPGITEQWQQILTFLAIASMVLGAVAAIGQTNIKRLMGYSAIGHIGFALVGLAAGSEEGTQGVLIYMAIYLAMTLGAFACILSMHREKGYVEEIAELGGLAGTNLGLAAIFGVLMFSLAGIPPLAGFWAKWYVFLAAIKAGLYPLAVIGVVSSVVGAFYYLNIVKVMFFDEQKERFSPIASKPLVVMVLSCIVVIAFSLPPIGDSIVAAAAEAARSLR